MGNQRLAYASLRPRLPFIGLALGLVAAILLVYATGTVASKAWLLWIGCLIAGSGFWLNEPRSRAPDEPVQHEKLGCYGFMVGLGAAMLMAYTVFRA